MNTTIKDYAVQLYWDDRAGYFVAEIPEIPTCAADGATPAEALANLEETFAVLKESYHEEGLLIPSPDPIRPLSVEKLSELSDLVKVSRLAKLAGIPSQTLATKLKRRTPFSVGESRKLSRVLREHGLAVCRTWGESQGEIRNSVRKSKRPPRFRVRGTNTAVPRRK